MTFKTQGIVLRRKNIRECDRVFFIYTRDYGKIEAVAKGACKIKSKLAAHLEPFVIVNLMIARGKKGNQIIGAEIERAFKGIRNNFYKIILANYCVEAADKLIKSDYRDERIFDLLAGVLALLELKRNRDDLFFFAQAFILKFLAQLGYEPRLYECVLCDSAIKDVNNCFSFAKGGVVCGRCRDSGFNIPISNDAIKIMRLILMRNFDKKFCFVMKKKSFKEVEKIIEQFLCFSFENKINSGKLLQYFKK